MTDLSKRYDYIFLGAGCATLSIIDRMISCGSFAQKKILILEKQPKIINDRTWCFWEKLPGYFEHLVHCKWEQLFFGSSDQLFPLDISPYTYKMIRGIDLYEHCFNKINLSNNIDIQYGDINIDDDGEIYLDKQVVPKHQAIVFNSIHTWGRDHTDHYLLQHFTGWIIETPADKFDKAILMDFNIGQDNGTSFMYILPLSKTKALIEYTLFTSELLTTEKYERELVKYIETDQGISDYIVLEKEFGVIPMTNHRFPKTHRGMCQIGTAGGQTKGSTGYTFKNIQTQSDMIVKNLREGKEPLSSEGVNRFHFYDSTLLNVLSKGNVEGKKIFTDLFKKNPANHVFKFLDNETSLLEDLSIISSLPTKEFLFAGINELISFKSNKD